MVNLVKITKLKNANLALILFEKTVVKMQTLHLFWNLTIKSRKKTLINQSAVCKFWFIWQKPCNSYILHSVKLNGNFHQHAFAVVWWYKTDHDQEHFGKPAEVWRRGYEPFGASLFMPVQRIAQKFACY